MNDQSRRDFLTATAAVALGVPTTKAKATTDAEFLRNKTFRFDSVDIAAGRRRARSEANVMLNSILRAGESLQSKIRSWLDQHGGECECDFCSHRDDLDEVKGEVVEEDLRGLAWMLSAALAAVRSGTTRLNDHEMSEGIRDCDEPAIAIAS